MLGDGEKLTVNKTPEVSPDLVCTTEYQAGAFTFKHLNSINTISDQVERKGRT